MRWRARWPARRRRWWGRRTVGPDAMSTGSSPGTSDITRLTTRAGWHAAREPAALDRRQVPPHAVHLGDRRAAGQQRAVDRLLVGEREPGRGRGSSAEPPPEIRQRTRSSAVRPRPARSMRARGALARRVGHRVRGLDDLDALARRGVAVARDHEARERPGPVILQRARHRGRGLAGADDDGAAPRAAPAGAAAGTARAARRRRPRRTCGAAACADRGRRSWRSFCAQGGEAFAQQRGGDVEEGSQFGRHALLAVPTRWTGTGAGSNSRRRRRTRLSRSASSTWYDSTRVTPSPATAASTAASAVLTTRRGRAGMKLAPSAKRHGVGNVESKVMQRCAARSAGVLRRAVRLSQAGLAQTTERRCRAASR